MPMGTASKSRNPTPKRPPRVRSWRVGRGLRAWRVRKETHGTKEARRVPAALITRAKQEGRRKEAPPDPPGVGLVHSNQQQGANLQTGEGAQRVGEAPTDNQCGTIDGL